MSDICNHKFYRPEWTCGRYDSNHKVAIYYNLIEGMSYFFEDYSAIVIGVILAVGRNKEITIEYLSEETNIGEKSISSFVEVLLKKKLLVEMMPTLQDIKDYRFAVSKRRLTQQSDFVNRGIVDGAISKSSAEVTYFERVKGITSVMMELTYNCSEKCIHCYNIGATRNDDEISRRGELQELSLQDYKRIIDELYEQGLVKVCLSGGDPFSKPFVWEIISYLYKKEIAFDVYTNGQRIVKDVERLAYFYPRIVGVSIYSGQAAVHDRITRIKGSWNKSIDVIRQLSELAIITEIKCCVMQPNVKTYHLVADIAKQFGATVQYEVNVTDSIEGDKCVSKYLRLTPKQLEIVLRDDKIPQYVGNELPNFGGKQHDMNANACGAGYDTFCIMPNGDMIPCCAFHLSFGNLKEQTVAEILSTSEKLKWWNSLSLKQYYECGRYSYCDFCSMCAGINYSEWGNPLKAGENNCYLAKVRYGLACKLKEDKDPLGRSNVTEALATLKDPLPIELQRVFNNTEEKSG